MTVPNFVIAGAARSGTTAIAEAIRAHPDAFVTQPKEPHYFAFAGRQVEFTGPYDDATINRVCVTDRDSYLALYPADGQYVALGDGSVSTLYHHKSAVSAISDVNPSMRIVLILRDPVERAFSSYQYLRARGFEPLDDFHAALRDEPRRVEAGWQHLFHYRGMSRYAESVAHFFDAFGRDQVGVWFYEDFAFDSQATVVRICEFLGLDPQRLNAQEAPRVNVSGSPRSRTLQRVIQGATRSQALRSTVKSVVPFGMRERIRRANSKGSRAPDDVRRELEPGFADDVARLAALLDGQAVPGWARG
ncbi:MAG: sulfotransferase family protein [Stackebrandtia sp.]